MTQKKFIIYYFNRELSKIEIYSIPSFTADMAIEKFTEQIADHCIFLRIEECVLRKTAV